MRTITHPALEYDPELLGHTLKLPRLKKSVLAPLMSRPGYEIRYTYFSILVNRDRCLPVMAAVNIKGEAYANVTVNVGILVRPRAVKSKPLKNVYPFDAYMKSKIRIKQPGRIATFNSIKKDIDKKGVRPLSKPSIKESINNGYGGLLMQFDLTSITL